MIFITFAIGRAWSDHNGPLRGGIRFKCLFYFIMANFNKFCNFYNSMSQSGKAGYLFFYNVDTVRPKVANVNKKLVVKKVLSTKTKLYSYKNFEKFNCIDSVANHIGFVYKKILVNGRVVKRVNKIFGPRPAHNGYHRSEMRTKKWAAKKFADLVYFPFDRHPFMDPFVREEIEAAISRNLKNRKVKRVKQRFIKDRTCENTFELLPEEASRGIRHVSFVKEAKYHSWPLKTMRFGRLCRAISAQDRDAAFWADVEKFNASQDAYVAPKPRSKLLLSRLRDLILVLKLRRLSNRQKMYIFKLRSVNNFSNLVIEPQMQAADDHGVSGSLADNRQNTTLQDERDSSSAIATSNVATNTFMQYSASEIVDDHSNLTDRYFPIGTYNWSSSQELGTDIIPDGLNLPYDFVTKCGESANCTLFKNYAYVKTDIKIKIVVNSNKFQIGQLQASWYYGAAYDNVYSKYRNSVYNRSVMNHTLINASTSNVAEMYIPFYYYKAMMGTKARTDDPGRLNMGHLSVKVLNKLYSPSTVYNSVAVTVFVAFAKCSFSGMIARDLGSLSIDPQMLIDDLMKEYIPGYAMVRRAMGLVSQIDADLQRDKPPVVTPATHIVPWSAHSWCSGDMDVEPINALRMCVNGQTPHPRELVMAEDEMLISHIVRKFGLVKQIKWSYSDTTGSLLDSWPASPLLNWYDYNKNYVATGLTYYDVPPVGVMSLCAALWRGSIEFRLDIVGTQFIAGRLMIGYVTRQMEKPTMEQLKSCPYVIFDVQGENLQKVVVIPYNASTPFWRTFSEEYTIDAPAKVYVYVLNSLVPMDNVAPYVYINVYMRAGPDFELAVPVMPRFCVPNNYPDLESVSPNEIDIYFTGGNYVEFGPVLDLQYSCLTMDLNRTKLSAELKPWGIYNFVHVVDKDNVKYKAISLYATGLEAHFRHYLSTCFLVYGVSGAKDENKHLMLFSTKSKASKYAESKDRKDWERIADTMVRTSKTINYADALVCLVCTIHEVTAVALPVEPEMDERDKIATDEVNVLATLPSTDGGFKLFGEKLYHLKQLFRKYTLYTRGTFQGGMNVTHGFNIPLLPQGKQRNVVEMRNYPDYNFNRESIIEKILYAYFIYRGGMRMRAIVRCEEPVTFRIEHRPDEKYSSVPKEGIDLLFNDNYNYIMQDTNVNNIGEFEVPFYNSGIGNFAQRPKEDASLEAFHYCLGNLYMGILPIGKLVDVHVDLYYCLADDFHSYVFQGFPPIAAIPRLTNFKDLTIEPQMGIASWLLDQTGVSAVADKLDGAADELKNLTERTKTSAVSAGITSDVFLDTLKQMFPKQVVGVALQSMLQLAQVLLNPTASSIAIAFASVLTSVGLLCVQYVQQFISWFVKLVSSFMTGVGDTKRTETESPIPDVNINVNIEPQAEESESYNGLTSVVLMSTLALLGTNANVDSFLKGAPRLCLKGLGPFVRDVMWITNFLNANLNWIMRVVRWVGNKLFPDTALAREIAMQEIDLSDLFKEMDCLLSENNRLKIEREPSWSVRLYKAAARASIVRAKLMVSKKIPNTAIFNRIDALVKLRDDMIRMTSAPPVRFEPYTIWICGESNVGKSRMINGSNGIAMSLLRHIGLTTWEEPCYVRTPGNPYWNGCRNQPVCVYDEFAALGGEHGLTQVAELFCLKSKAIFNPPQAEIKDKNIRYNPKLVIMASNQHYPVVTGVAYEKAFHRRRDSVIYVSRNEAFYKQHGYELDLPPHMMDETLIRNYEHLEFQFMDPIDKSTQPRTDRLLSYDQMLTLLKARFQKFHDREMNEYIDNLDAALTLMPGAASESVEDAERHIYERLVAANKYRYSHLPETREFLGCAFEEIGDDAGHTMMPIVYAHLRFLKDHFKREYEQYYAAYPVIRAYESRVEPQMMKDEQACVCIVNQFINEECRPIDAHLMCNKCFDVNSCWADRYQALASCHKLQHIKVKHAFVNCCVHKHFKPSYSYKSHVNIILDEKVCTVMNVFEGPYGYIPVFPCFGDCVWSDENVRKEALRSWIEYDSSEREYIRSTYSENDLPYDPMTKTLKIVKLEEQSWLSWALDSVVAGCSVLWNLITNLKLVIGAVAVLASIGGLLYLAFRQDKNVQKDVSQEMFISGDFRAAGKKGKQTKKEIIVKQVRGDYVPQMGTDRQFTILRYVQRNACFIVAESETSSIKGRLLGFADRFALGPSHYMDEFYIRRNDSKFYIVTNGVKIPVLYEQFKCEAFEKSGLGVYTLPVQVAPFKNILTHFAPIHCHESVGEKAYMLEYSFDLGSVIPYAMEIRVLPRSVTVPASGCYKEFIVPDGYTYRLSKKGLCGSILLSENLAEGIIGMHVAGASNSVVGFSEMVTREQLLPYLNRCKVLDVVEPELSPYVDELKPEMGVSVLGVVDRRFIHRESGVSKIIPTECHGEIFKVYCDVPVLSPRDERIQGAPYSPLKSGVDKHGHITLNFPQEYIDIAAEDMRRMLLAYVRPARLTVGKLTKKQAIAGIPDLVDYDKLNFNTSEGFPFSSLRPGSADSKRWLFDMHQDERGNYVVNNINDIVIDVCRVRKMQRLNRILPFTVFTDCLKDQKVAKEKVCVPGKVRIFSISDVAYTIQSRQYFMDFTVAYQQSRFQVEHMVGVNADSDEWGRLAARLLSKGDNIVTADYSNFGPNLNLACAVKFIDIVNEWYSINGSCTDAHNVNREILFYEVMHSLHLVYGTIYRTYSGLPSGGPLTTIQNSFVNCMYIRVVWLIKFSNNLDFCTMEAFHMNVELFVYGDDLIESVTDVIKDLFNCRDIAEILSSYGIVIKNASKLDTIKPYSKLLDKDTTFLKRGFLVHPFRPLVMLAPLAVASVEDTCNYTYRDWQYRMREISLEACDQTIRSAYGHGPEYYEYVFDKVSNYWFSRGERLLTPSWREIDESIYG